MERELLNEMSAQIIGAAIEVHTELGPGLLESVYHKSLFKELTSRGFKVQSELSLPVYYKGELIQDDGLRVDLLVEDIIVLELKSVESVRPVHKKQLLTYLKIMDKPLGLLINFNEYLLKTGITRIIN